MKCEALFSSEYFDQSRHHGSFGKLSPPKESFKPLQIEILNTINQWNFLQIL